MKRLKVLLHFLKGSYPLAFTSVLFAFVSVASKMAIPFLTGLCVDMLEDGNFAIYPYLIAMIGLLLAGSVFRYFFDLSLSYIGNAVVKRMRDAV